MNKSLSLFRIATAFLAWLPDSLHAETDLTDLNLEELLAVKITSVAKKVQSLQDSAAAVFVISDEDIKRSGATSIPDALRLAPGIDVGRIDSNKWAVSARGFNGRFANKLLVLIDGRSLYTPAFAGVYWELQDVMLEDVERIEVIRGSGAALWGANAVNGVVNIITKHSADTQGGLLSAGGGSEELGFGAFRYGKQINASTSARVYLKGFERDALARSAGQSAGDAWNKMQGGFRLDSDLSDADSLTLQGDMYAADLNQQLLLAALAAPYRQTVGDRAMTSGGNIISRWQHTFSDTSSSTLQLYFDSYNRREAYIEEERHTGDLDFQHRFALNDWNDIIWGLGFRYSSSDVTDIYPDLISFNPTDRDNSYYSGFVQDQLTLVDDTLWLTLGSKLEHNDFTGFEVQPTARLMWGPHPNHRVWGAVSRGVRIPSRVDADMSLVGQTLPPFTGQNATPFPLALAVMGSQTYQAEQLLAYEVGYRFSPNPAFSLDIAGFYNNYSTPRSYQPGAIDTSQLPAYLRQPFYIDNGGAGRTYGIETSVVMKMLGWWRWDVSYSALKSELSSNAYYREAISPQHKLSLRAALNPVSDVTLDAWLRYVDNASAFTLAGPAYIRSYTTLDLRLGWKLNRAVELALVGQNLLDNRHLEYIQESFTLPTEVQRGVYGKITWEF
ncbi:TonB-dependent siderophore receptor [Methylomonas sp. DH-1]|uniref:TonB-dependent receptor plug domain-containing protein n=1 Tax=Methylomonas sp. (strain DH-1) TaxID=1727196 RepID=UPI0007C8EEC7|nr:TonB-dependent receptor [Methylomonas sp. DH-1]ANE54823.1 TonB-dependent receptor [Methylomonas sp. DH-1]